MLVRFKKKKSPSYLRDRQEIFTIFETFATGNISTLPFFLSFCFSSFFPLLFFFAFFFSFYFFLFFFDILENIETHSSFDDASPKCKIDRATGSCRRCRVTECRRPGASCFWHDDLRRSADMILHDWLFINSTLRASIYTALFISTCSAEVVRPNYSWPLWKKDHPRYSARCRKTVSSLSSFISNFVNSYRVFFLFFFFFFFRPTQIRQRDEI